MTLSGVYLVALRWIFFEFPLKNVLLQVSTSSLDQYLSGLITQFTFMINLDLVVGSLDFISDVTSVCWAIFLHLLLFRRANDKKKKVLPTAYSAKTQHWLYFMKRAGSLAWLLRLKIWAAVEAEELLFLKMYLKILARPLDFQQLYIFLKISVDFPFVLVDPWYTYTYIHIYTHIHIYIYIYV